MSGNELQTRSQCCLETRTLCGGKDVFSPRALSQVPCVGESQEREGPSPQSDALAGSGRGPPLLAG